MPPGSTVKEVTAPNALIGLFGQAIDKAAWGDRGSNGEDDPSRVTELARYPPGGILAVP